MNVKSAVHFRRLPRKRYKFERIRFCRRCGSYTTLWGDSCLSCQHKSTYTGLRDVAHALNKRLSRSSLMWVGVLVSIAVFTARNLTELIIALVIGISFLLGYAYIIRQFSSDVEQYRLQKILHKETDIILVGLHKDLEQAEIDLQASRYKDAYEKLREISQLIDNNALRLNKIKCLQHFILRKDMELELSSLLPDTFDKNFTSYLLDVIRLQPQLVNRAVIEYVILYKEQILLLPYGRELLVHVASSAMLVKGYLLPFHNFIHYLVPELHRESLLRLCRQITAEPEKYPELVIRVKNAIKLKYEYDPEFQGLF